LKGKQDGCNVVTQGRIADRCDLRKEGETATEGWKAERQEAITTSVHGAECQAQAQKETESEGEDMTVPTREMRDKQQAESITSMTVGLAMVVFGAILLPLPSWAGWVFMAAGVGALIIGYRFYEKYSELVGKAQARLTRKRKPKAQETAR
jgi:hypothetical protein